MKDARTYLIGFIFLMVVASCATSSKVPSATESGSRTIILEGETVSADKVGGFTSWYCKDFINGGPVLVEVGFLGDPSMKGLGFILYDGGYTGEFAGYQREGLNHRWDWGPNGTDYSFVIKPDGIGIYYDFTTVPEGETTTGKQLYKCKQRKLSK